MPFSFIVFCSIILFFFLLSFVLISVFLFLFFFSGSLFVFACIFSVVFFYAPLVHSFFFFIRNLFFVWRASAAVVMKAILFFCFCCCCCCFCLVGCFVFLFLFWSRIIVRSAQLECLSLHICRGELCSLPFSSLSLLRTLTRARSVSESVVSVLGLMRFSNRSCFFFVPSLLYGKNQRILLTNILLM